ncbi:probable ATP-binding cassette multidrug transport protein; ABC transporter [Cephalotrichum gorgonifer]|uniref:Probable ATP-binding cassette multidrug transport protein ABC transporter n=1 Tax=Cephalotrichum gorgonifer TaxID=2041049 RepID=A0AAE8SY36_9PEZI|nr:probable ATP-binding cassette multidrug transport protein; ABC transporter [Cephalotrichum gorgonifer]
MESDSTLAHYEPSLTPPAELGEEKDDTTWAMKHEVEAQRERDARSGFPMRRLGVTWKNLTVQAVAADASIHENMLSQFNIPKIIREARHKLAPKSILDNINGCVKPGEMLLVLGRPGSGCTTLLKILANAREGYTSVSGDVHYGSMDADEAKQYRSQIVMNTEEELFFPTLTVGQTMDFATRMKIPFNLPEGVTSKEDLRRETRDFLLRSMYIEHTPNTKVGNEYVRGVSGGERKRVSIIECMASRGSVFCWDNSTRGLDASTALEYTKAVRAMTDVLGLASIVTLYQAGNGIYNLFDKVLVLDGGKEIFYGTKDEARPFMEELGFICGDGANVADYLTGATVPTERKVRPECQLSFPRTAQAVRERYQASPIYPRMMAELDHHSSPAAQEDTRLFKEAVSSEKHKTLSSSSALTVSFSQQITACIVRQYQILWGDKATVFITQFATLVQALITGSLFYNSPDNTSGLFTKSGALFFSILFHSLISMSEVTRSFTGRPILAKHKAFAFYHPAAVCIAQIVADIPVVLFQVTHFGLVVYWMVALKPTAAAFFTYWITSIATTLCMTAMFRAIGAAFGTFDAAAKVSGLVITVCVMYTGFMIQYHQMHPWFIWLFWLNPMSYAFDALVSNEFKGTIIPCVNNNLIPNGPGYQNSDHQSCAGVIGAVPGQTSVTGEQYLHGLAYAPDHIWRNFGVLWAWWVLYVAITIFFTSRWRSSAAAGQALLIPRENAKHVLRAPPSDAEAQHTSGESTDVDGLPDIAEKEEETDGSLVRNTSIFTWKNLTYTVKTPTGDRILLDNVQGWVKPGMLGALMGSSGAGKTTLLDVLAQRKTEGTINGSILVDGRPLPVSFQRSAGYCEQLDVHEPYATVREALEFSALLRQSRDTPRAEKLKYVDTIINLLELHDLADTLIGKVGSGLSVEQRKRVTIGVELVSKPSILIFLDEPTSGLDGQSAYNTVRFLRKLADAGQAVLVTIHQPSAQLFAEFDTLLLLSRGGKTVYFGDIGENGRTVTDYFARNGIPCPPEANPAEHMIDVVSGQDSKSKDWNKVWLESPEHSAVVAELDAMISDAAAKPPGTLDDGHEFSMPLMDQVKIVTHRMNVALFRNTDYVNNKMIMHITKGLFNGFSYWMIGSSVNNLQARLFTVFQFIFVAPGVIAQLQPLFIARRDIFEAREKKSKMYSWIAFTTGLIVSEIPYLCICAVLYFACWYYTVGFPKDSNRSGATFFVMLMYEFVYTGIGQSIAAYAPNAVFASLVNPLVIGTLISFCGVLVPYAMIQPFWRYWLYYLNPFNYLMGSMLVFTIWGTEVKCDDREFALFNPPNGTTCGAYLNDYMHGFGSGTNLINPDATADCRVCTYASGNDYLRTLELNEYYYGWRDAGIVVIFVISSYACVFLLMKLRTKASKKAE